MKYYTAPIAWTGRIDLAEDIRWHQRVKMVDLEQDKLPETTQATALIGFACDEGVRRNKGRVGAVQSPNVFRKAMASYAWHFPEDMQLLDVGNVECKTQDLESAQAAMSAKVAELLTKKIRPVVLGGGHETAFASYMGLRQAIAVEAKVGIINFDAHFDLRLPVDGATSGTPFCQMADWCKANKTDFNYFVLGINPTGNTGSLFQRADELGVQYITNNELFELSEANVIARLNAFIAEQDYIYLTIDLDGFDAAYAPGVSAPANFGFSPAQAYGWIKAIKESNKLALFDICELNPIYDIDNRTAKLGASLVARLL